MDKKIIIKDKKTDIRSNLYHYPEQFFDHKFQVIYINQLYLNIDFEHSKQFKGELNKKLNSYKQQDISKKIFDSDKLISLDEIIEKVLCSKLICHYCSKKIYIVYKNQREKSQWTLDRIDNSIGHHNDNVLICCLDCNLKRRRLDKDKFLFTKKMNLIKLD
uniref:Uncharacterized protein n=1 Tax=viral metagenome TaxID=1070528 RepID=A0A6C0KDJ6_9ZZZZ